MVKDGNANVKGRSITYGYSDSANTINFMGAVDAGNYYLAFTNCDDNASNSSNYYTSTLQKKTIRPTDPNLTASP